MPDNQDSSKRGGEEKPGEAQPSNHPGQEPVWTYRGYQLKASEFTTAMVHFFRAEISRANVWRQRLDTTTNWAVITAGAAITIAFNQAGHHGIIIVNTLLVTLFLYIEARRYRYYELWSYRVRLMETDFFAAMLVPPFHPASDWAESLAENLLHPDFPISMWEALGRRLRRNFLWIYMILGIAWLAKNFLFPKAVTSLTEFLSNAAIGSIPGWIVLLIGVIFYICLFVMGLLTSNLHQATGEILPRYMDDLHGLSRANMAMDNEKGKPWFRLSRKRQQLVAFIITNQSKIIGEQILQDMRRGATALYGEGLYTGSKRQVLLCALTATEVNQLKSLVYKNDPQAFVIVSPAREVLGKGFMPLHSDQAT